MQLKEKQKTGKSDDLEETIINFRNADGSRYSLKVRRGTDLKAFLASIKHEYVKGLNYKLNNVLLEINKESGELLENPFLEGEENTLVIQQSFTGGPQED